MVCWYIITKSHINQTFCSSFKLHVCLLNTGIFLKHNFQADAVSQWIY